MSHKSSRTELTFSQLIRLNEEEKKRRGEEEGKSRIDLLYLLMISEYVYTFISS